MGTKPSKEREIIFKNSKNYNIKEEEFTNRTPGIMDEMWKRTMNLKFFYNYFTEDVENLTPSERIPEEKPDLNEFLNKSSKIKVIWLGHSSILLNIDGIIILIDPVFSDAASPICFINSRFQKPVISLNELPQINYIIISHDHYDHLDMNTIKYFTDKNVNFITPLGVGSHLEYWGITSNRIIEKDWWEEQIFEDIKFIATPSQHFSGRGVFDGKKTLWASWIIESKKHKVYFSGDSGYDIHFKQIGEKYGPFDVAFIESGQYNKNWPEGHLSPDEGVKVYKDLKSKVYFPIHWGMFALARHSWNDPINQLKTLSEKHNIDLVVAKLGQLISFE